MTFLGLLTTTLCLLFACWLWSRRRFYRIWAQLSGPLGLPFVGIGLQILKPEYVAKYFEKQLTIYKSPFIIWLGSECHLYTNDPETIETVFTSPSCVTKGHIYRLLSTAVGDGLFTSSPPRWNKHRRLLNPAFNRKIVQSFLPIFNQKANELVNELTRTQGQSLEVFGLLKKSIFQVVCHTTTAKGINFDDDGATEIFDSLISFLEVIMTRMLSPWLHSDFIYRFSDLFKRQGQYMRVVNKFTESCAKNITRDNKEKAMEDAEMCDNGTSRSNPFMDCVRSHFKKGQLTFEDIVSETTVIIAGSFETISTTVYFICLCLAMHPECQDKLYNELVQMFPSNGPNKNLGDVTVDDLPHMPYTEMVINEAMRLFAPVPMVVRSASTDLSLRSGIVVPRGTQITIDIFHMQRSEQVWGSHARSFDPDRHFGVNSQQQHPYAFIPFTKGIRMCIGYPYALLHMKILVAKIFLNFRIQSEAKMEDLEVKGTLSLKLSHYPHCTFQSRDVR